MAVFEPEPKLFARQISSIQHQTLKAWHCFIGIDGRSAETVDLTRKLTKGDPRFFVHEFADRKGFYGNFERVSRLAPATCDWVAFADQDDAWDSDKLERLVSQLQARQSTMAVTGQARIVDAQGRYFGLTDRRPGGIADLLMNNAMTGSFMVVRPGVLRLALPFPEGTDVAFHDHWLGVCAASMGEVLSYNEPLQDYVQHEHNVIGETRGEPLASRWRGIPRGRGLTARLVYVSRERWGWRVRMAATLLERAERTLADDSLRILRPVARGRLSLRVVWLIARGWMNGKIPSSRAFALIAGAASWPLVKNRSAPPPEDETP